MARFRFSMLILFLTAAVAWAIDPAAGTPPVARKVPHQTELHGEVRSDDYFWLKDKSDSAVIEYIKAENAYTEEVMKPTLPLQTRLYKELLSRVKQTDRGVPYEQSGYWYYNRTEEGKQYPILCRKRGSLIAPEEIILDANDLARGKKFFQLGSTAVSDNGAYLAFTTDTTGFREYELSIKDLGTGKLIEERIAKAPAVEWAADNETLFYLTEDDAKRAYRLWRHSLGGGRKKDTLVFEERDELFWLDLSRSRDRKYIFRTSTSYTCGEQRYIPADDPTADWKTILRRKEGHEYSAEHRDGMFYIRTNKDAPNFRVVTCPVEKTDPSAWRELLPHDPAVLLEGLSVWKDFAVVQERQNAQPDLRVIDLKTGLSHYLEFPEPVYDVTLAESPEFTSERIRYTYSSPVTPPSTYEYDPATGGRKLLKREQVLGGYNAAAYQTERIYAQAEDGSRVPISLVYRKGVKREGSAPLLLYGYGAYGIPIQTSFDANLISLLDRGVVYAWAHIRGGSDMGRTWYDDGKMLKKKNTFTDFIACADYLVKEGYCDRGKLVIQGLSAGGLLIGATLNLRPDLCKAAVAQVPFVDAINSMSDESIPLTVQEFQQWGNPKKKEEYDYMKTYCPYSNVEKKAYPAILVTTSLNDSQVMFHEPTKYVAKLRALKTDKNPLLYRCNMEAGHGGASGRYDALKEEAFVMAFILDQMGVSKPTSAQADGR